MKKTHVTLFFLFLFFNQTIKAQKVDLDKERAKIFYVQLPQHPILNKKDRTYSIESNIPEFKKRIKLHGFTKIKNNGKIKFKIEVDELLSTPIEISKTIEDKKDKNGKVISTSTFYSSSIDFILKGRWFVNIEGEKSYNYPIEYKKKLKSKQTSNLDYTKKYFKINYEALAKNFKKDFLKKEISHLNYTWNHSYGYKTQSREEIFWILDSKKNPDTKNHKRQFNRIKEVFGRVKANSPITKTHTQYLDNFEQYFNDITKKYAEDKKKHRKMRYSSYYNLAKLYYNFDMPDKAIKYANLLIENGYDKSDGRKIIKKANKLKELFTKNEISSTHFYVKTIDTLTYHSKKQSQEKTVATNSALKKPRVTSKKIDNSVYALSGNEITDNKVIKKIIDNIQLSVNCWQNSNLLSFEGKYIYENKKIIGKKYLSFGNDKYKSIKLDFVNKNIVGAQYDKNRIIFIFDKNGQLSNLSSNTLSNFNYKFIKNSSKKIIKLENKFSNGNTELINLEYNNGSISKISKKMKKGKWGGKTTVITINNSTKHSSLHTETDKNNAVKIKIENNLALEDKNNVTLNKKYTYHTGKTKNTTTNLGYTDFGKIKKKYEKSIDSQNTKMENLKDYEYVNNELSKKTHSLYKGSKLVYKFITNFIDLNSKSNDLPEYEWKKGAYEFDKNNELISISRGDKIKRKTNGVWTEWKLRSM